MKTPTSLFLVLLATLPVRAQGPLGEVPVSGKLGAAPTASTAPPATATTLVLPAPPFTAQPAAARGASRPPKLRQLSAKANQIIDEEAWYRENGIGPIFLKVSPVGDPGSDPLPENVPGQMEGLLAVRAFRDEAHGYVVYGEDYSAGHLLVIWDAAFSTLRYRYDFSAWRRAPKVVPGDEAFVDQALRYAKILDGVLYVAHGHSTYARSSGGMNAYLSALDATTGALRWRSQPLACNSSNFLVVGDAIVGGYGFTDEKDFVHVLDRHTGRTAASHPVKSGPEVLALIGDILHVRTYNTDYRFRLE